MRISERVNAWLRRFFTGPWWWWLNPWLFAVRRERAYAALLHSLEEVVEALEAASTNTPPDRRGGASDEGMPEVASLLLLLAFTRDTFDLDSPRWRQWNARIDAVRSLVEKKERANRELPLENPDYPFAPPPLTEEERDRVAEAVAFAAQAHAGQVYRGYGTRVDESYILHPLRVMLALPRSPDEARVVAVLHDVLEDTEAGMPDWLGGSERGALIALTRNVGERYEAYIERIRKTPGIPGAIARGVKIADLRDNLAHDPPERLRKLYEAALEQFGVPVNPEPAPPSETSPGTNDER